MQFLFSGLIGVVFAQPYHNSEHQSQLKSIRKRAADWASQNKNRAGLEDLRLYDQLSDTLFARECRDTVAAIEAAFRAGSAGKLKTIETNRKKIVDNSKEQEENKSAFFRLFRKSLLALGVWLIIVFFLIKIRNRKVRTVEAELAIAKLQAANSEKSSASGRLVVETASALVPSLKNAYFGLSEAEKQVKALYDDLPAGDENAGKISEISNSIATLTTAVHREAELVEHLSHHENAASEEAVKTSVNILCDRILELCHRGHCMDPEHPFECQVTRDLEKNLPLLPLHPEEVASLLVSVLDNAFLAVKERAAKNEKGYQPKVSVSTRILPRFVQIRIKDNGVGIPSAELERVREKFYSTRTPGEGAGLGLSHANKVLTERHKGEMRIESEAGQSTDVYLKFFT